MSEQQGTIHVEGFEMNYRIEGADDNTGVRNVIVIGSTVYYPRTFSQNLRQHTRLIFMDHRGFGKATGPFTNDDFELDKLVDDIETLRKALGLSQVIILGHSGHGYMALEYAKKYPENVSCVVIIAMSPDSSADSFEAADRYLDESVSPERKALYTEDMSHLAADIDADPQRRFIHYSLRSSARIWYDYTFDSRWMWDGVEPIAEMFDYVWGKLFRGLDITVGLAQLDKPVMVALGRYDYWNPPHLWESVRAKFRNLRIRVFEKSGHTPQFEQADDFDRELLVWLDEKS